MKSVILVPLYIHGGTCSRPNKTKNQMFSPNTQKHFEIHDPWKWAHVLIYVLGEFLYVLTFLKKYFSSRESTYTDFRGMHTNIHQRLSSLKVWTTLDIEQGNMLYAPTLQL